MYPTDDGKKILALMKMYSIHPRRGSWVSMQELHDMALKGQGRGVSADADNMLEAMGVQFVIPDWEWLFRAAGWECIEASTGPECSLFVVVAGSVQVVKKINPRWKYEEYLEHLANIAKAEAKYGA
jgi:hypothetical protein